MENDDPRSNYNPFYKRNFDDVPVKEPWMIQRELALKAMDDYCKNKPTNFAKIVKKDTTSQVIEKVRPVEHLVVYPSIQLAERIEKIEWQQNWKITEDMTQQGHFHLIELENAIPDLRVVSEDREKCDFSYEDSICYEYKQYLDYEPPNIDSAKDEISLIIESRRTPNVAALMDGDNAKVFGASRLCDQETDSTDMVLFSHDEDIPVYYETVITMGVLELFSALEVRSILKSWKGKNIVIIYPNIVQQGFTDVEQVFLSSVAIHSIEYVQHKTREGGYSIAYSKAKAKGSAAYHNVKFSPSHVFEYHAVMINRGKVYSRRCEYTNWKKLSPVISGWVRNNRPVVEQIREECNKLTIYPKKIRFLGSLRADLSKKKKDDRKDAGQPSLLFELDMITDSEQNYNEFERDKIFLSRKPDFVQPIDHGLCSDEILMMAPYLIELGLVSRSYFVFHYNRSYDAYEKIEKDNRPPGSRTNRDREAIFKSVRDYLKSDGTVMLPKIKRQLNRTSHDIRLHVFQQLVVGQLLFSPTDRPKQKWLYLRGMRYAEYEDINSNFIRVLRVAGNYISTGLDRHVPGLVLKNGEVQFVGRIGQEIRSLISQIHGGREYISRFVKETDLVVVQSSAIEQKGGAPIFNDIQGDEDTRYIDREWRKLLARIFLLKGKLLLPCYEQCGYYVREWEKFYKG